ncbi:hypothetical protein NliqN6_5434 [Naganishia liquefaciens]|mgnify:CR=1 FL=1|uniref:Uncharacterized protein n=1 Tax=Naganishia liquefaciens TaxID=104408 RepID=A0A8H3TXN6_9TREE|nr:hypothetical protein NliqN6_5434 [Naganishia liquefaciens]
MTLPWDDSSDMRERALRDIGQGASEMMADLLGELWSRDEAPIRDALHSQPQKGELQAMSMSYVRLAQLQPTLMIQDNESPSEGDWEELQLQAVQDDGERAWFCFRAKIGGVHLVGKIYMGLRSVRHSHSLSLVFAIN